ncbi:hypothetical protein E3N88_39397 [Mikania micrantha]|uniref:Uncharacterized protein n=1 Tax=Mikania micrantha TaxID=192012 RepID=A0A5N6LWW0_9ASTR|nr:hypothetical protein E3N88_39397 [Mikania micrantha]
MPNSDLFLEWSTIYQSSDLLTGLLSYRKVNLVTLQLLAKDPALERFKSYRKGASRIRRVGDYLTIAVVAGCCYEIYVRAVTREEARKALKSE